MWNYMDLNKVSSKDDFYFSIHWCFGWQYDAKLNVLLHGWFLWVQPDQNDQRI